MQSPAILILDYEEAVRDSIQLILRDEGYRCFALGDECRVPELLEKEDISIIILDSELAIKTELLSEVKETHPDIKFIVVSSYAALETCRLALVKQADEFILKPLDFDELIDLVEKMSASKA